MKLTSVLFQDHAGKMFRAHWKVQGKKRVMDHGALRMLKAKGIEFEDALDIVKDEIPNRNQLPFGSKPLTDSKSTKHETHPDFNEIPSLMYGDHSVLIEGLNQAKVLTNTVELSADSLPISDEVLSEQELPLQDKLVKRCVRSSIMYDAYQEKLPIRKDPLREAWRFPRDYGITDKRKNYLLVNRLLQLCSSFSPQLLGQRSMVNAAKFVVPVTLTSGQRILFAVTGDAVVFAEKNTTVRTPQPNSDLELPDISPLAPTVSLESTNFYKFEPSFPLNADEKLNNIHTVMLHYNETQVGNIFKSPVSSDQILGRSLMQGWILAMSQAQQANGGELLRPITIQTVQTNGQFFHFSVFQLNSTSCSSNAETKNYFWSFPVMNIFEHCSYQRGLPVFEGYNDRVFKTLLAFYNNC